MSIDIWQGIKMIVADTTNVNTGRFAGVVVKIQNHLELKRLRKAPFFGCQHIILDRAMKHCLDKLFGSATQGSDVYCLVMKV